jgi:hypothetical protein
MARTRSITIGQPPDFLLLPRQDSIQLTDPLTRTVAFSRALAAEGLSIADVVTAQGRTANGVDLMRLADAVIASLGAADRSSLVMGTYYPDATNTGLYQATTKTVVSNITYSTNGQTITDTDFNGARVSVAAANVTFRNCLFQGDNSINNLVTCSNAAVSNAQFIDCEFLPKFPTNRNGIAGHDFTLLRCDLSRTTDLVDPSNNGLWTTFGDGFPIGVTIQQSYLHDMCWWTAATGGVVHPTDTETHNDAIQIVGGDGLNVLGCTIDARFARQYAHWQVTNPAVEPYSTVALHSLADGGPYQAIPERGVTGGSLTSGNDANGRYNWDDLSGLMINATQGPTTGITFTDNYCRGGNFFINGGGNPSATGLNLGSFLRNAFVDDTGNYGSAVASENGHTFDFGGTWSGKATAPVSGADKNFYLATGNPITVRF